MRLTTHLALTALLFAPAASYGAKPVDCSEYFGRTVQLLAEHDIYDNNGDLAQNPSKKQLRGWARAVGYSIIQDGCMAANPDQAQVTYDATRGILDEFAARYLGVKPETISESQRVDVADHIRGLVHKNDRKLYDAGLERVLGRERIALN